MAKRIGDLTAADFPNVDPAKFERWKEMQRSVTQKIQFAMLAVIGGVAVQLLVGGVVGAVIFIAVVIGWFAVMLGHIRPLRLKADAFGRENGIDDAAFARAGIDMAKARATQRTVIIVVLVAGAAIIGLLVLAQFLG